VLTRYRSARVTGSATATSTFITDQPALSRGSRLRASSRRTVANLAPQSRVTAVACGRRQRRTVWPLDQHSPRTSKPRLKASIIISYDSPTLRLRAWQYQLPHQYGFLIQFGSVAINVYGQICFW
jgi:hypothetical protein